MTSAPRSRNTNSTKSCERRAGESIGVLGSGGPLDAYFHGYGSSWLVHAVTRGVRDFVGDVLPFDDFTENGVTIVKMRCRRNGDEELAAVGVWAGIRHRELAGLGMPQRGMKLIFKRVARAAAAIPARTSALNHELRNYAVEGQTVVIIPLFFFPGHRVREFL